MYKSYFLFKRYFLQNMVYTSKSNNESNLGTLVLWCIYYRFTSLSAVIASSPLKGSPTAYYSTAIEQRSQALTCSNMRKRDWHRRASSAASDPNGPYRRRSAFLLLLWGPRFPAAAAVTRVKTVAVVRIVYLQQPAGPSV